MVRGHSTQCAVLLPSVNRVLLPCRLRRLRNDGSSSVAENRFLSLLSLAPSVTVTRNCHLSASENKYKLSCFQIVLNLLLIELYTDKCVPISTNFQTVLSDGIFKNNVWSEPFISGICYCTVFEEGSFIASYLMALFISMLASRVLWKNVFLGNAEN